MRARAATTAPQAQAVRGLRLAVALDDEDRQIIDEIARITGMDERAIMRSALAVYAGKLDGPRPAARCAPAHGALDGGAVRAPKALTANVLKFTTSAMIQVIGLRAKRGIKAVEVATVFKHKGLLFATVHYRELDFADLTFLLDLIPAQEVER